MQARAKKVDSYSYTVLNMVAGYSLILSGSSFPQAGQGLLLMWWGLGMFLTGAAYLFQVHGIFGKSSRGNRSWLLRLVFFPTLAMNYTLWHIRHRVVSKEDSCNLVAPGVWLGRRPLEHELPPSVSTVVDLTCEMTASPSSRKLNYICLPILDGYAPSVEALFSLILILRQLESPLYIHCAAGHGRSAMVAVALLVARGYAKTLEEAEEMVRAARPAIAIKSTQQTVLKQWYERWTEHIASRQIKRRPDNEELIPDFHIKGQKFRSLALLTAFAIGFLVSNPLDLFVNAILIIYWSYLALVILRSDITD